MKNDAAAATPKSWGESSRARIIANGTDTSSVVVRARAPQAKPTFANRPYVIIGRSWRGPGRVQVRTRCQRSRREDRPRYQPCRECRASDADLHARRQGL